MDLDALSGVVAYKHTGDDVTTVTAACDRITIRNPLTEICDLEYSGRVTYATGRSSMEITLQVAKAPKEGEKVKDEDVLLHCSFTMVSLDPGTKKLVPMLPRTNLVLTRGQARQRQPHRSRNRRGKTALCSRRTKLQASQRAEDKVPNQTHPQRSRE